MKLIDAKSLLDKIDYIIYEYEALIRECKREEDYEGLLRTKYELSGMAMIRELVKIQKGREEND